MMARRILTERWIPERELEKDLRTAWGADTLVLGASRPLTRFLDAKGFAVKILVGGSQQSSQ